MKEGRKGVKTLGRETGAEDYLGGDLCQRNSIYSPFSRDHNGEYREDHHGHESQYGGE